MQLRILQASTFALDNLKKASVPTVHSVYHKAVNLRTGDQMLTLQPRASVLSPVSLITDYTEEMLADLTFMVGQQLTFHLNTSHTCARICFYLFLAQRQCSLLCISPDWIPKSVRLLPWQVLPHFQLICVEWN